LGDVCREWCCRAAVFGDVQVVVMQVDFVACFCLFVFKLLRFALLFHLFSTFEFGIWIMVGRVFGQVKVSALVVHELRGALMICVGSLVDRSLLI
jgi:hypothetical protein